MGDALSMSAWTRDAMGSFVPSCLADVEDLLLRAEENALENDKTQHALTRALQLYSHANYLAGQQLDAAAEWRYRVAASIAAKYAQPRMAAHSLATLGGLLVLRNRHHEALATADDALSHAHDTVALYLQGSMRLKLGNLHTD